MGGCCCSCCGDGNNSNDDKATSLTAAEIELQAQQAEKDLKSLAVARGMSAPTIEVMDRVQVYYMLIYITIVNHCKSYSLF